MTQGYIADGINHPSAVTLLADGAQGWLGYVGTPNSAKDMTAAQYADYVEHRLLLILAYENLSTDISGGGAAGAAHANAFLADARKKKIAFTENALPAVDEHVSSRNIPGMLVYVRSFRNTLKLGGWKGRIGIYGFSEVLIACHDAGITDFYVGAGSKKDMPPYVNIWQDNTTSITIAGSADDKDWILVPLPATTAPAPTEEIDVQFTDKIPENPAPGTVGFFLRKYLPGTTGVNTAGPMALAIASTSANVTKIAGALPANQAALLAAVDAHLGGGTSVADMETAFAAVLGAGWTVTLQPPVATA
jgi:hypothetical protein